MIADNLYSSSPWQSADASVFATSSSLFDLDADCLNTDVARARGSHDFEFDLRQLDDHLSVESSVASSECSAEDLYRENEFIPESDNLSSLCETLDNPFLCCLDVTTDKTDEDSFGDSGRSSRLKHATDQNSNMTVTSLTSLNVSQLNDSQRTETTFDNSSKLTWGSLSAIDKLSIVQDLTEIISTQLGLREQLDVIRIVNPRASVSLLDTEFAIDLEDLDDRKVEEIRAYINQQQQNVESDLERSDSPGSRSSTPVSDSCSDCCVSPPAKKRMSKKQREEQQKLERQRRKKEARQIMKEKRSGLFKSEQVLSLSKQSDSHNASEEEVDIIT